MLPFPKYQVQVSITKLISLFCKQNVKYLAKLKVTHIEDNTNTSTQETVKLCLRITQQ